MFVNAYKTALVVLSRKPIVLWGLSLMSALLSILSGIFLGIVPALGIALGYLLTCGVAKVYLDGLAGQEVYSDQLFAAFNKNCFRVAGGMAWRDLWILIWVLIPIAGPIIAIVKSYSYKFVPYILITRPDVSATQALRLSKEMTDGIKMDMFLADLCYFGALILIVLVLSIFAMIPVIGILFGFALLVFNVLLLAFGTIFTGLYQAYFYAVKNS